MKGLRLLLVAAVLVVSIVPQATATTVGSSVTTAGGVTTYVYGIISSEFNDLITSFHVYAPVTPALVTDWEAEDGWLFQADPDPETGGADLYWYAPDPASQGIPYGGNLQVSMSLPSWVGQIDNYVVPGYIGNWGYETYNFAGWGVLVSFPSVPVPVGTASTPEPATILVLSVGCAALAARIRRRRV